MCLQEKGRRSVARHRKVLEFIPRPKANGNEGVIESLEKMLAVAREGRMTGIAIAAIDDDKFTYTNFCGGGDRGRLIGAVEYLKHRLLVNMHEDD